MKRCLISSRINLSSFSLTRIMKRCENEKKKRKKKKQKKMGKKKKKKKKEKKKKRPTERPRPIRMNGVVDSANRIVLCIPRKRFERIPSRFFFSFSAFSYFSRQISKIFPSKKKKNSRSKEVCPRHSSSILYFEQKKKATFFVLSSCVLL